MLAVLLATVFLGGIDARADDVKAWRDERGRTHITIQGDEGGEEASAPPAPADDRFSVEVSLRRRALEKKLVEGSARLGTIRAEIAKTEKSTYLVDAVPTPADEEERARWNDLRRNALLAASSFEEEKRRRLFKLRRDERAILREIRDSWSAVDRLRGEVRSYYGKMPAWWIDRLRCAGCPTFAEIEKELERNELEMAGKAEPKPTPSPTPQP